MANQLNRFTFLTAAFVHSLVTGFVCVKGRVLAEKYKLNHRTMSSRAERTETEHHHNNYSTPAMRTLEVLMLEFVTYSHCYSNKHFPQWRIIWLQLELHTHC